MLAKFCFFFILLGGSLGHKCNLSIECLVKNSHCKNGRCLCLHGFKMLGVNQCIGGNFKKVSRNEPLKRGEEIKLPLVKRPSLPGGKCIESKDCLNKSFCHQGKCVCPRGMKTIKNYCIEVGIVPPLSSCSDGQICAGNSECSVNGICLCPQNYTLYKGFCQTDEQIQNLKKILGNEINKKKGLVAIPNLKIMEKINSQEKLETIINSTKIYLNTTTISPKITKKQTSTPKIKKSTKLPIDGIIKNSKLEKEIVKNSNEKSNQTKYITTSTKESITTKKFSLKTTSTTKTTKLNKNTLTTKSHTTSTLKSSPKTSTEVSKTTFTTTPLTIPTTLLPSTSLPTSLKILSTKNFTKTTYKPITQTSSSKLETSTISNKTIPTTTSTIKIESLTTFATNPTTKVYNNTIIPLNINNETNTIPTTPDCLLVTENPINIIDLVNSVVKSNEIIDNKNTLTTLSPEITTNITTTKLEITSSTEPQIISLPNITKSTFNETITNNVNITSIVEELLSIKKPFILPSQPPTSAEEVMEEENYKETEEEEIKEILPSIEAIPPPQPLSNANFYKIFPNLVSNTYYSNRKNTKPLTIPHSLFQISYPGQFCDDSIVFCPSNSKCEQNICQCIENYYLYDNDCLPIDKNVNCISNDDCPLGAFCLNNECQCEAGMRYSRFGFCVPDKINTS